MDSGLGIQILGITVKILRLTNKILRLTVKILRLTVEILRLTVKILRLRLCFTCLWAKAPLVFNTTKSFKTAITIAVRDLLETW